MSLSARRSAPAVAALVVVVVVLVVVLTVAVADFLGSRSGVGSRLVDIGVGLAFLVAAATARAPAPERWLVTAVGVSWLAGLSLEVVRSWHQGFLVAALAAFPAGRLRGRVLAAAVVLAVLVSSGRLSQGGVALAFFAVAALALAGRQDELSIRILPALGAAGLGAVLVSAWLWPGAPEPALVLAAYQSLLVLIAAMFPLAARGARVRGRFANSILDSAQPVGLEGLVEVLRTSVVDPDLDIFRWLSPRAAFVDTAGEPVLIDRKARRWLRVMDGDEPVAVVGYASTALDQSDTAEAVASAVRLTVTNERLQEQQRARLGELQATRVRLLAAADRTREQLAVELRDVVRAPIDAARQQVQDARTRATDDAVRSAVDVARQELEAADADIDALVTGVPPHTLGAGRLRAAITSLARSSPVPVTLSLSADVSISAPYETVLFYVCSEALSNTVKHANASMVTVTLSRDEQGVELTVEDDGGGGADLAGSGLAALSDRLQASNGRLRVSSPPGAGTVITASLPG